MKSESTIFYKEFLEITESFKEEDQLQFLKLVLRYGLGEEIKTSQINSKFKPTFIAVKSIIDKTTEKYKSMIANRSEAGKKGMANRWNKIKFTEENEATFKKIVEVWNAIGNVNEVKRLTDERKTKLYNILQTYKVEDFEKCADAIKDSEFLRGHNKDMWIITFDWLIEEKNFIKVIEGNYKTKDGSKEIEDIWK